MQGAWANHYSVQRAGLADMFFESAAEERHHAFTLLGYLRMRGHNELDVLPDSLVSRRFAYFSFAEPRLF